MLPQILILIGEPACFRTEKAKEKAKDKEKGKAKDKAARESSERKQ